MKLKKLILVGPGASGKDFLAARLCAMGFTRAVAHTTRPRREGEVDGKTYNFVSLEEFRKMIRAGEFVEWVVFGADNWHYGTTRAALAQSSLIVTNPSGLSQFPKSVRDGATVIYLDPAEVIREARLQSRNDADTVERRLASDRVDFRHFADYDIRITRPEFDPADVLCAARGLHTACELQT